MTNLSMTADRKRTHTNIRIYLIFFRNILIGLHFAAHNISLSFKYFVEIFTAGSGNFAYLRKRDVSVVRGYPRSLTLVPIESVYVTSY